MQSQPPQPMPEGAAPVAEGAHSQPGVPSYGGPMAVSPNPLAIASLVCSLGSWFILPIVGAIAGVVLGHLALSQIRHANGKQDGHGMAVTGLVVGYVHLAIVPIIIVLVILFLAGIIGAVRLSSFAFVLLA
jgi:heme/copper-type cytochrome/quinol oxidase subunit 2